MNSNEKLKQWYNEECAAVANDVGTHKRKLFTMIKIYFWFLGICVFILSAIAIFIFFITDDYRSSTTDAMSAILLFTFFTLFALVSNLYLIYLFAKAKFATLETLENKKLISPLDNSHFNLMADDILDLATKMGIEKYRITLWQLLSNNKYPSVEEDTIGRVHILLPINFMLLYKRNKVEFNAIICHELAHVVQKDTDIFQVCNTYYSVMRTMFVPNAVFNLVMIGITVIRSLDNRESNPMLLNVAIVVTVIFNIFIIDFFNTGKKKVTAAREKSELLADASSYIYFGDGILNLLKDNKDVEEPGGYHPSPQKRFDNLTTIISTNN